MEKPGSGSTRYKRTWLFIGQADIKSNIYAIRVNVISYRVLSRCHVGSFRDDQRIFLSSKANPLPCMISLYK